MALPDHPNDERRRGMVDLNVRVAVVETTLGHALDIVGEIKDVAGDHVKMDKEDHAELGRANAETRVDLLKAIKDNGDRTERQIASLAEKFMVPIAEHDKAIKDLQQTRAEQKGARKTLVAIASILPVAGGGIGWLLVSLFGPGK